MTSSGAGVFDDIPNPPLYSESIDFKRLYGEYAPATQYFRTVHKMPPHEIRALQERRFLETVARGWQVPFYQKLWGKAGLEPEDIRGINVFPEAIATVLANDARCNGEYFCTVDTVGEARRDEMTVKVEVRNAAVDRSALKQDLERRFKEVLSVKIDVEVVDPQALDKLTGLTQTSKIKRVADRRKLV